MADGKIDPFDVVALERAVNESAGRVSGIWLSFVAFSAYLAAAASMISHRQIFLEEPIKLPTINIDLPLFASAILLPLLFVIYHIFVLLQVVLLARTADTYNEAIDHGVAEETDRIRVRQRLANTLFAQLFAGSPREREGVLGWLLRAMAWITLAIAPVGVLIVFEIRLLPYHSAAVTWTHRALIAVDLLVVLYLWAGAIKPANDIRWQSLRPHWRISIGAVLVLLGCTIFITFPGESGRAWMRYLASTDESKNELAECRLPKRIGVWASFDRLVLPAGDFVDHERLEKVTKVADANKQKPYQSERTRSFLGRDLRCGRFPGADFRHVDFGGSDLSGAILRGAHLQGTTFAGSRLVGAILDAAQLQDSSFAGETVPESDKPDDLAANFTKPNVSQTPSAELSFAFLRRAQLQGVNFEGADLEGAHLEGAQLQGANFKYAHASRANFLGAELQGAFLESAEYRGAYFYRANLQGMSLYGSDLHGAYLRSANLRGASLIGAILHAANLAGAELQGASLNRADLKGATLESAKLQGATFIGADLRGASLEYATLIAADLTNVDLRGASLDTATAQGVSFEGAAIEGASLRSARLQGAYFGSASLKDTLFDDARLQGASFATDSMAGAVVANAFLWRTRLSDPRACLEARIVTPRFDHLWDIILKGRRAPLVPYQQEISPAIIEAVVEDAKGVPAERVEELKSRLMALLNAIPDDDNARTENKIWSDCAEATTARNAPTGETPKVNYEGSAATFLIDLGCTGIPDRKSESEGKYVVEGIYQYRIEQPDSGSSVVLSRSEGPRIARAFLGLDGKPCPGAKDADEATKAGLRELAMTRPAN